MTDWERWESTPLRDKVAGWRPLPAFETSVELVRLKVEQRRRSGEPVSVQVRTPEARQDWDRLRWFGAVYVAGWRQAREACGALGLAMPEGEDWRREWRWPWEGQYHGDPLLPVVFPSSWKTEDGDQYGEGGRHVLGEVLVLDVDEVRAIVSKRAPKPSPVVVRDPVALGKAAPPEPEPSPEARGYGMAAERARDGAWDRWGGLRWPG